MSEQVNNITLIQEVEKNPCLYDNKHKGYSKKNISEKTWFEVGKAFNLTGKRVTIFLSFSMLMYFLMNYQMIRSNPLFKYVY